MSKKKHTEKVERPRGQSVSAFPPSGLRVTDAVILDAALKATANVVENSDPYGGALFELPKGSPLGGVSGLRVASSSSQSGGEDAERVHSGHHRRSSSGTPRSGHDGRRRRSQTTHNTPRRDSNVQSAHVLEHAGGSHSTVVSPRGGDGRRSRSHTERSDKKHDRSSGGKHSVVASPRSGASTRRSRVRSGSRHEARVAQLVREQSHGQSEKSSSWCCWR